jgi:uncharacterized protein (DUF1800 family)
MGRRASGIFLTVGVAVACISVPSASSVRSDDKTIVHVLNRIAFGSRPGDVERVRKMGLERYVEEQLHPERIADADMNARLSGFTTLGLSTSQISEQFERPQLELRKDKKFQAANPSDPAKRSPEMMAVQQRANSLLLELSQQKVLRAVYSERQLQEVLTDFWFNHFNVDSRKGRDRFMLTAYERDAIRPHVLGKFRDLLEATAKSPAMLFYLDNWMSADPNGPHPDAAMERRAGRGRFVLPQAPPAAKAGAQRKGLNENYGRELMELHTLGVDGGYTQKDVTEVARAFTGWTIGNPQQGGEFRFEPRIHDEGEKIVLGHRVRAGGINDGEAVLDILASQPSTAHFISFELVRRFVNDTPPPALVDRAAARFRDTSGDLREVMRTILTSEEFLGDEANRAKVKTPFEFVVSSVRATGADVADAMPLVRALQQLGMPLYQCQPPTGYKDTADAWTNTGALVARMNLALQLSSNKMRGVSVGSVQPATSDFVASILNGDASDTTRATIAKASTPPQMLALALGSPEFQKR